MSSNTNRELRDLLLARKYDVLQLETSSSQAHRDLYQAYVEYYNNIARANEVATYIKANAYSWFTTRFRHNYQQDYFEVFIKILDRRINLEHKLLIDNFERQQNYRKLYQQVIELTDPREKRALSELINIHRDYVQIPVQVVTYIEKMLKSQTRATYIVQLASDVVTLLKIKQNNPNELKVTLKTQLFKKLIEYNTFGLIVDPDNVQSMQLNQNNYIVDALSYGPIAGLVDGVGSISYNGTPYVDKGIKQYPGVRVDYRSGEVNQPPPLFAIYESQSLQVNEEVKQDTQIIKTVNFAGCDYLQVTFSATKGGQGDNGEQWVTFSPRIILQDKSGATRTINGTPVRGAWRGGEKVWDVNIKLNPNEQYPITLKIDRLEAILVGEENKSNSFTCKKITGYRERVPDYPGVAYVAQTYDSLVFDKDPKRTFLIKGRVVKVPDNYDSETRAYKGEWQGNFKEAFSDNPAWIIYDLLTNDNYGLGRVIQDKFINRYSFYQAAKYYDQTVTGGRPRYTCNLKIEKAEVGTKLIQQIAESCRSNIVEEGGVIHLRHDYLQKPIKTITNRDVLNGTFTRSKASLTSLAKRFVVNFTNPDNDYQSDTVVIEGVTDSHEANNEQQLTAYGCTNHAQALSFGLFSKRVQEEEGDLIDFTTDLRYNALKVGDVIQVADEEFIQRKSTGRFSIKYIGGGSQPERLLCMFIIEKSIDPIFTTIPVNCRISWLDSNGQTKAITFSSKLELIEFKGDSRAPEWDHLKGKAWTTKYSYYFKLDGKDVIPEDGSFLIWDDSYMLEEFKILNKTMDFDKGLIRFNGQRYSSSKYSYADKGNALEVFVPKNYTPALKQSNLTDVSATYIRENRNNVILISWIDSAKTENNTIKYNVFVKNNAGVIIEQRSNVDTTNVKINSTRFIVGETYTVEVCPIYGGVIQDANIQIANVTIDTTPYQPIHPSILVAREHNQYNANVDTPIEDLIKNVVIGDSLVIVEKVKPQAPAAAGDLFKLNLQWNIPHNSPTATHYKIFLSKNQADLVNDHIEIEPFITVAASDVLYVSPSNPTANKYTIVLNFSEEEIERLFVFSTPNSKTYQGQTYIAIRAYNENLDLDSTSERGKTSGDYVREQAFKYSIDLACTTKIASNFSDVVVPGLNVGNYVNGSIRGALIDWEENNEENIGGYFENHYPPLEITISNNNPDTDVSGYLRRVDVLVNGQVQTYLNSPQLNVGNVEKVGVAPGVNFMQRYTRQQYIEAIQRNLASRGLRYEIQVVIHTPFGTRHRFTRNLGSTQITAENPNDVVEVKESLSSLFITLKNDTPNATKTNSLVINGNVISLAALNYSSEMHEIVPYEFDLYFNGQVVELNSKYPQMNFNELEIGEYSYRIVKRNIYGATKTFEGTARVTAQEHRLNYPIELPQTLIKQGTLGNQPNAISPNVSVVKTENGFILNTDLASEYSWAQYFNTNKWTSIEDVQLDFNRITNQPREHADYTFTKKTLINSRIYTGWIELPFNEVYKGEFAMSGSCKTYGNNVWISLTGSYSSSDGLSPEHIKQNGYKLPDGEVVSFTTRYITTNRFDQKTNRPFFFIRILIEGDGAITEFNNTKVNYKLDYFTASGEVDVSDVATVTLSSKFVNITGARVTSVSNNDYKASISYVDTGYANAITVTVRDKYSQPAQEPIKVTYIVEGY